MCEIVYQCVAHPLLSCQWRDIKTFFAKLFFYVLLIALATYKGGRTYLRASWIVISPSGCILKRPFVLSSLWSRFRRLVLASAPSSSRGPSSDDSVSFSRYMSRLLQPAPPHAAEVAWLNAMGGRLLYDFLNNDYWANKVSAH